MAVVLAVSVEKAIAVVLVVVITVTHRNAKTLQKIGLFALETTTMKLPVFFCPLISVNPSDCLGAHNSKRRLHRNTLDLTWDAGLARESKAWADKLAKENRFDHGSSGENLYRFGTTGTGLRTCRDAVNAWYLSHFQY